MRFVVLIAAVGIFLLTGLALTLFGSIRIVRPPWLGAGVLCVVVILAIAIPLGRAWSQEGKWAGHPVRAVLHALLLAALAGMMTSWIVFRGYLPALNAWLDDSPAAQHRVNVQSFGTGKMRRYLTVDSWRGNDFEVIQVPTDLAEARPRSLVVTTRSGLFGMEWVESVVDASAATK